jgi:hypothetical protein
MKLKKIAATVLLAGTLTVGTAGIASAEGDSPAPTRPTQEQICHRAKLVWQRLQYLDQRAQALHDRLTAAHEKAVAEGNTDLAARLEARIAKLEERHDRVVARIEALKEKGQGRCAAALTPEPAA